MRRSGRQRSRIWSAPAAQVTKRTEPTQPAGGRCPAWATTACADRRLDAHACQRHDSSQSFHELADAAVSTAFNNRARATVSELKPVPPVVGDNPQGLSAKCGLPAAGSVGETQKQGNYCVRSSVRSAAWRRFPRRKPARKLRIGRYVSRRKGASRMRPFPSGAGVRCRWPDTRFSSRRNGVVSRAAPDQQP